MKNLNKYKFRYEIISILDGGFYSTMDAAWELNLSVRHVRRLLARFRQGKKKLSALSPESRPSAWNGMTQSITDEIIRLRKENQRRSNEHIAEFIENKFLRKISLQISLVKPLTKLEDGFTL